MNSIATRIELKPADSTADGDVRVGFRFPLVTAVVAMIGAPPPSGPQTMMTVCEGCSPSRRPYETAVAKIARRHASGSNSSIALLTACRNAGVGSEGTTQFGSEQRHA